MLPRLYDRWIALQVLGALGMTWAVLLGFDAIFAFAAELDEIGEGDFTAWTALGYVGYTLPRRAYELFPSAAMIGCVLGLGGLSASSELTALRAAGVSRLRICIAAAGLVAVLTALMALSAETLAPWGEQRAQSLALQAKSREVAVARWSGLWAREADTFLNARQGRVEGSAAQQVVILDQVRLYTFGREGKLDTLALAERAEHRDGQWTLFKVHRARFTADAVENERKDSEVWASKLKPELLSLSLQRPRYLSTATLRESLDYLERNRLDPGEFAKAYWARWFYPLNAIVLCLAVMPFAFTGLRSGGFGKRLFLAIVIGLGYFLIQRLGVDMAQVYQVDLRIGNLIPPLAAALLAIWYFRRHVQG